MATDGVKIIDGDYAHDTYWGIMDMYDTGADLSSIENEFPLVQQDCIDDFDREIYVTACGLAYWEIGLMTEERLHYIKSVIDKGACVKEWTAENEKDGKARQKELDKYWKKISCPNSKIRSRKKYRKITNLYFEQDDLLTFKLKDGNYRAVICVLIKQYRGQCNYILVPTTYNSSKKPTVENIKDVELLGRLMGCGFDEKTIHELQPGIGKILELAGEDNYCYLFGVRQIAVSHKDFIHFKDKFEKVGTLQIAEDLKRESSFGYKNNFDRFEDFFGNLEKYIEKFNYEKYSIKALCVETKK